MPASILFVDDEKPILRSLRRMFQEFDYDLYFAENGEEALQILREQPLELIISDMRMPQMDGHTLLKQVKATYPNTMRLILSGFAEKDKIFRSLLDGSAQMYLLKPWENQAFIKLVENVLQLHKLLKDKCLLEKIKDLEALTPLPTTYYQICRLIEEESEVKEIAALIKRDPVIAGKVLHVANSAFFGAKIGSVHQAITYLGLGILKDVVLMSGIFSAPASMGKVLREQMNLLWSHANLVNQMTGSLYQHLYKKKIPEDRASVGLLHDLGAIALVKQFGLKYMDFIKEPEVMSSKAFQEQERQNFGLTHAELGGYLLHWWQLPYPLIEAALFHHDPLNSYVENRELLCLVHIADLYSWKLLLPAFNPEIEEEVWHFIGFDPHSCDQILLAQ